MKIPIIQANEPLEQIPVTATTKGSGRTWDAVEKLSGQVQDIGLGIAEKQQQIKMFTELNQGELDMQAANEDIVNNLRKNPNPDTYFQDWSIQFNEAKNKRLENVKGGETKSRMAYTFNRLQTRELVEQKHYGNILWNDTTIAQNDRNIDEYLRRGDEKGALRTIDNMVQTGLILPTAGNKRKDKANETLAFNEVMANPESVEQIIKNRNINVEFQDNLRREGEIETNRKWNLQRRKEIEAQKQTDDTFFKKITEPDKYGTLTIPEINSSGLPREEKTFYVKALENSVKAKKTITDPAFATKILDNILSGNTKGMREMILADAAKDPDSEDPPKLGTQQSEMLLRAYWAKREGNKEHYTSDPWFSLTKSYFRDQLGIKEEEGIDQAVERMIKGGVKPSNKNMEYYYKATTDLMRAVEKSGLKGEPVWNKGKEILTNYMVEISNDKNRGKTPEMNALPPTQPPQNNLEGRYEVNGVEWKWTKKKGWYK